MPVTPTAATRFAGCVDCVRDHLLEHDADLRTDTACDVCGADNGTVSQRLVPWCGALVSIWTGECCDELVEYGEPEATTTYLQVGRNDACPCGSGRKFKRCHGGPR